MFLIGDSLEDREKLIFELNLTDPTSAFILAFSHFKWTVNRLIISLSKTPTSVLKSKLECIRDAQTLKSVWKKEVTEAKKFVAINSIVKNWEDIKFAYPFNEKLLTNATPEAAMNIHLVVPGLMEATYNLCEFARENKLSLYKRYQTKNYKYMRVV